MQSKDPYKRKAGGPKYEKGDKEEVREKESSRFKDATGFEDEEARSHGWQEPE